MARIMFIIDPEEGHFLPTFGLAGSLKNKGHDVYFLSIFDCKEVVSSQGFLFETIATKYYPKGYREKVRHSQFKELPFPRFNFLESMQEILNVVHELKPDVLIFSTYLSFEALVISHWVNLKIIIFTPYLLSDSSPIKECYNSMGSIVGEGKRSELAKLLTACGLKNDLHDFVSNILNLTEIICCPKEFDLPGADFHKNAHHIEPSIRKKNERPPFLQNIEPYKKIIYVSMGSQNARFISKCKMLYSVLIDIMESDSMKDYHLILAAGNIVEGEFNSRASNITVLTWAPQIEVLERASLMINHGGLGSVKECIYFGVPMIVFPDKYDQPANAERVVYHNLGAKADFEEISKVALLNLIKSVDSNLLIQTSAKAMMKIFREGEEMQPGVRIIESHLP